MLMRVDKSLGPSSEEGDSTYSVHQNPFRELERLIGV